MKPDVGHTHMPVARVKGRPHVGRHPGSDSATVTRKPVAKSVGRHQSTHYDENGRKK